MPKTIILLLAVCSAFAVLSCTTVRAQISPGDVISVDFGITDTNTNLSPNWNDFDPRSRPFLLQNLVRRSDGSSTGVDLNASGFTNSGGGNASNVAQGGSPDISIYEDHIFSNDTIDIITLLFRGLDDNLSYDLTGGFFRTNVFNDRYDNTFTVGTDVRSHIAVGGAIDSYELFEGLSSSGGEILLTIEAIGANPSGTVSGAVALISELTLTASAVPEPNGEPIFKLTFDDSFVGSEGETPLSNSGAVLGRGVRGLAAILDSDDIVQYEAAGNIDSQNGTIDFIVIPFWNGNDGVTHEFLVWGGGGGLLFSKDGANNLRQIFNRFSPGGQSEIGTAINVSDWVALEPHYLAYTWSADQRRLRQYVDGQMVREVDFPDGFILPTITAPDFRLGSNTNGGLDELRLFDREVTPGEVENRFNELLGVPATLGDVDLDGDVDFADIPAFIAVLLSGDFQAEADCDVSGVVDFADIPAFIAILLGS